MTNMSYDNTISPFYLKQRLASRFKTVRNTRLVMETSSSGVEGLNVTYHNTVVARYTLSPIYGLPQVTLNSGGYRSKTTKERMNVVLQEAGLPYYVKQKDFDWYIVKRGEENNPEIFSDFYTVQADLNHEQGVLHYA